MSVSPATWVATDRLIIETDVRSALPAIRVPTLVLHRRDSAWTRVAHGRYLAEHIPDARLVELSGDELRIWKQAEGTVYQADMQASSAREPRHDYPFIWNP